MDGALRIQAVKLPVRDPESAERFYRWCFRLEPAPEGSPERAIRLGWGREDRLLLARAAGGKAEDAVTLRLPAMTLEAALGWCSQRDLEVIRVEVGPEDLEQAAALLPGVAVEEAAEPAFRNLSRIAIRGWAELWVELVFPLPTEMLARRGTLGPYTWSTTDWTGLETPGLLGVTWGGPDVAKGLAFCRTLGLRPLDEAEEWGPLRIGDQQVVLEEKAAPGLYGIALVVPEAKIAEVKRTLAHLGAEHRQSGNRILAADPDGRIVFVQGMRIAA